MYSRRPEWRWSARRPPPPASRRTSLERNSGRSESLPRVKIIMERNQKRRRHRIFWLVRTAQRTKNSAPSGSQCVVYTVASHARLTQKTCPPADSVVTTRQRSAITYVTETNDAPYQACVLRTTSTARRCHTGGGTRRMSLFFFSSF